ncbi:hypothetical protein Cni_G03122 [Canna indica]|uniref:RING-type domain-containing protein n=1 Tax=Canna indica TaxID=4628 RepID=A0AAQ3Q2S4_9LILI|nr:hypothetical protein Cni_G03122 [Canna indica]
MLSASGLLYNWRSRAGRSHNDPDPALDPPSSTAVADPHSRHRARRRRRRRPIAAPQLDHPRRLPHLPTDHEPAWIDSRNDADTTTGSISNGGTAGNVLDRLRLARNDQLPGVVLQARARLQERLRGISLSGSSHTNINSGTTRNEVEIDDDVRVMNLQEWETENVRDWFDSGPNLTAEADEDMQYTNRPPGLSSEAFHNLQVEVYQDATEGSNVEKAFVECSICLEKFLEGDEMIRLSCGHRFHSTCLEPWVKTCGDCPYCRGKI